MKILFDISALGASENPHQRGTVGIFRLIEHAARGLAKSPDFTPHFYARQNRAAARRYFQRHLEPLTSPRAKFVGTSLRSAWLSEALTRAEDYLAKHYVDRPWRWLAVGRILWKFLRSLLSKVESGVLTGTLVYHSLSNGFPSWTDQQPCLRRIFTVYDLIPLVHPEFYPAATARGFTRMFRNITSHDWILCISESTRRDVLAHFPICDPDRVLVTTLAAEEFFRPEHDASHIEAVRQKYGVPTATPYFLSVSTLEPRKNFETVIRAYARFVRDDPTRLSRLVLVGGKVRHDTHPIFAALDVEGKDVRQRIIFTGFVPDSDLSALYSGALAFVYLSFYEGFGLPALEAMQCGLPVIASNSSSLPEVIGEAGILLDASDDAEVCRQMRALYLDPGRRSELSAQAIARAKKFSWERFTAETLAAYRQALATEP